MSGADQLPPEPSEQAGTAELQADIARTREQLGETAAALADKLDVKGRAEQKVAETKQAVVQRTHELGERGRRQPAVPAGLVVALLVVVGVAIWRRRR